MKKIQLVIALAAVLIVLYLPLKCNAEPTIATVNAPVLDQKYRVTSLTYIGDKSTYVGDPALKSVANHLCSDQDGQVYTGPEWMDSNGDGQANTLGEHHFPISYKRGVKITVHIEFHRTPQASGGVLKIKGEDSLGLKFNLTYDPGNPNQAPYGSYSYNSISMDITSTDALPDSIKYVPNFSIKWKISEVQQNKPDNFMDAGTTDNRLYITFDNPNSLSRLYETPMDVSCRNNETNVSQAALKNIFSTFHGELSSGVKSKDKDGYNKSDGIHMTYWGLDHNLDPYHEEKRAVDQLYADIKTPDHTDVESLISTDSRVGKFVKTGRCGAWADFLTTVIDCQGLKVVDNQTGHEANRYHYAWVWGINPRPDRLPVPPPGYVRYTDPNSNDTGAGFIVKENPGQGNANPPRAFANVSHAVVKFTLDPETIFDPSYGVSVSGKMQEVNPKEATEQQWEDDSIEQLYEDVEKNGFVYRILVNKVPGQKNTVWAPASG